MNVVGCMRRYAWHIHGSIEGEEGDERGESVGSTRAEHARSIKFCQILFFFLFIRVDFFALLVCVSFVVLFGVSHMRLPSVSAAFVLLLS